jgi:hypothetical protein
LSTTKRLGFTIMRRYLSKSSPLPAITISTSGIRAEMRGSARIRYSRPLYSQMRPKNSRRLPRSATVASGPSDEIATCGITVTRSVGK